MRRALISIAPFLASSSVVLFAVATNATTWLPPARPLAHDEKLELAVSESDAVGLGFVVGVRETIVDVADGTGIAARSLTLRPKEWLRGAVEGSTVEVGLSASDHSAVFSDALLARGIETQPALFFLRRSGSGWSFRDYPDPASLQVLSSADIGPMKQRILRAISRQSPDSLLARADVIALGHRGETEACPLEAAGPGNARQ